MKKRILMAMLFAQLIIAMITLAPKVQAAEIIIQDDPTQAVIKPKEECMELVNGADGEAGGLYVKHGDPNYNIWLRPGGYVTVASASECSTIYVQYHSSDDNDGVTDIYVDNMSYPIIRIDTYMRGQWYVEIRNLPNTTHNIKIQASTNSDMTGVIPSPHRPTPGTGDNDVWYYCFEGEDWWPMFHHDQNHTGKSLSPAPDTNEISWTCSAGTYIGSSPAVSLGNVYIGSNDDSLHCLDATTGEHIWSYGANEEITSSPAVAIGKVYVGSQDYKLYCLDALNADSIWTFTTGGPVWSSPTVALGNVYFGSNDFSFYCLDASDGDSIWAYSTGYWYVNSSPAVADSKVYFGTDNNKIYCLDALNGDSIWCYTTGSGVTSSPAVVNGKVYVGSFDGNVYCLDASNGDSLWAYTTGSAVFSSPAVTEDKVYVGSLDGSVYCLDASTGNFDWSYPTGDDVLSSPAVADDKAYVGSDDGNLYCLDASNGNLIWSYSVGSFVLSSPAVAYGKVYVATGDGEVYCFGPPPFPAECELIWAYRGEDLGTGMVKCNYGRMGAQSDSGFWWSPYSEENGSALWDGSIILGNDPSNLAFYGGLFDPPGELYPNTGMIYDFYLKDEYVLDNDSTTELGYSVLTTSYYHNRGLTLDIEMTAVAFDDIVGYGAGNGVWQTYKISNTGMDPIFDLRFSMWQDWNVYDSSLNITGSDNDLGLIWQYDITNPDTAFGCMILPTDESYAERAFGVHHLYYIYPNAGWGWNRDTLWNIMNGVDYDSFINWPEDSAFDFSTTITTNSFFLYPDDTINIVTWSGEEGAPDPMGEFLCADLKFAGFYRGDVNNDGRLNVLDFCYLNHYLFTAAPPPKPFVDQGDVNADGAVTTFDMVYLLQYFCMSGPPPIDYPRFPDEIPFQPQPSLFSVEGFCDLCKAPVFPCGDANGNEEVTIADVVYLVNYILKSGPAPKAFCDVNCNYCTGGADPYFCPVDASDLVYLTNYLFKSGPEPCAECPL